MIRFLQCAVLTALIVAPFAGRAGVDVVRTLGAEDDELFLHNPMAVTAAGDGSWYLLNAGECRVLHLDADWELLDSFGGCGQGPGEFENPRGLVLLGDEVWVFEMARITVFGRDGEHRRTLTPGLQYASPTLLDGRIAAVMGVGERSAAFLDRDGAVVRAFGTECPDDFFAAFKACRNQQILPHPDGLCALLNPVSGRAWLVDDGGETVWEKGLVPAEDTSRMTESDDGETVTLAMVLLTGGAARHPDGRYWLTLPGEDDEAPMAIRILDARFEAVAPDIPMPEGVSGFEIFFAPDGLVGLVSTWESVIHLCRIEPETDGG